MPKHERVREEERCSIMGIHDLPEEDNNIGIKHPESENAAGF